METAVDPYILSFESEPVRNKHRRHHWMISLAERPDELVSWGHASTHEPADSEAQIEIKDLLSGLTQGGQQLQTQHAFRAASIPLRGIRQKRLVQ